MLNYGFFMRRCNEPSGFLTISNCKSYIMTYEIRSTANTSFTIILIALHALALIALPSLLNLSVWYALLLLPLLMMSSLHWGLIHEGIHKNLLPDAEDNDRTSRLLGILMGASFHVLRFGHLMHHKLNRDWHSERIENSSLGARAYYYANLFFGLYLGEVITSLLFTLLPQKRFMQFARATFLKGYEEVAIAGERFFFQRGNVEHVRNDMMASLAIYGGAFWFYGAHWPVLLGFLFARAMVISFLDNIYHYATPADNSKAGKELVLPEFASLFLLRSNFHETHHLNPEVPWHALPQVHVQQGRCFDGPWMLHARLQLNGPVV